MLFGYKVRFDQVGSILVFDYTSPYIEIALGSVKDYTYPSSSKFYNQNHKCSLNPVYTCKPTCFLQNHARRCDFFWIKI